MIPNFHAGGAQRVAISLVNQLIGMHLTPMLVVLGGSGTLRSEVSAAVPVIVLDGKGAVRSVTRLREVIKSLHPHCTISFMTHVNLATLLASLTLGGPRNVIVTEHGMFKHSLRNNSFWKKVLILLLSRLLYPHALQVVAVSQEMQSYIERVLGLKKGKASTIYNGVPISQVRGLSLLDPPIPVPASGKKLVVAVGRLVEAKDFEHLIESFSDEYLRRHTKLVIVGEGPLRKQLELRIAELGLTGVVALVGHQPNPYAIMRLADVIVQSSIHEGLPTTLVEAVILGKPIVATDCSTGPREILENGKWGVLVPVRDRSALAHAIKVAIESTYSPPTPQVIERFSAQTMARHYVDLCTGGKNAS